MGSMTPTVPPHRDLRLLGLVALGGALGSVLRYAVWLAMPRPDGWPLGTLAANVAGAFALGLLLEAFARRGPQTPRLLRLRLTLGTGLLGGFTTYSSLALEVERLLSDGRAGVAAGYVAASLVVGTIAALLGVTLGARVPRSPSATPQPSAPSVVLNPVQAPALTRAAGSARRQGPAPLRPQEAVDDGGGER